MKCTKCGGSKFIIETTIAVTEEYKIYKNGNVSYHPVSSFIVNENLGSEDNLIICVKCKLAYVPDKGRDELLNNTDYKNIVLDEWHTVEPLAKEREQE